MSEWGKKDTFKYFTAHTHSQTVAQRMSSVIMTAEAPAAESSFHTMRASSLQVPACCFVFLAVWLIPPTCGKEGGMSSATVITWDYSLQCTFSDGRERCPEVSRGPFTSSDYTPYHLCIIINFVKEFWFIFKWISSRIINVRREAILSNS